MERDSTAGGAEDLLLEDKVSKLASDHNHNAPELCGYFWLGHCNYHTLLDLVLGKQYNSRVLPNCWSGINFLIHYWYSKTVTQVFHLLMII